MKTHVTAHWQIDLDSTEAFKARDRKDLLFRCETIFGDTSGVVTIEGYGIRKDGAPMTTMRRKRIRADHLPRGLVHQEVMRLLKLARQYDEEAVVTCEHKHTRPVSATDSRPYCVSCLTVVGVKI